MTWSELQLKSMAAVLTPSQLKAGVSHGENEAADYLVRLIIALRDTCRCFGPCKAKRGSWCVG
jgi:hypothetical protein